MELRHLAHQAFICQNIDEKLRLASELYACIATITIANNALIADPSESNTPGVPAKPVVQTPLKVDKRSPYTLEGHAALIHSICHIEFNAINLALDAIWRFANMPEQYYKDWAQVAKEEAYHFNLLRTHLRSLQKPDSDERYDYGDFPAHGGLWDMCVKTKDDILARMALVPRTLEARGLDATPQIQIKLRNANTPHAAEAVALLDIILRDEIGHVTIGNHWYNWLCQQRGLDPVPHYRELHLLYNAPKLKAPFNHAARLQAGFTQQELDNLIG